MSGIGEAFAEEAVETELAHEEPRTLGEILEAEREFFDKIWYVPKLILREKIEAGDAEPLPADMDERMREAIQAIEARYGSDNVGPWDDWGWGLFAESSPPCGGFSGASGTFWILDAFSTGERFAPAQLSECEQPPSGSVGPSSWLSLRDRPS